ncbi:MAG: hypothetical protein NVV73_01155 [Cellvibrionaceae bacterium]|nr:hypothetical protein [Cellvibrionaceae bacterium]
MTLLRPSDATSAYRSYLRRLANMLDDQPLPAGRGALHRRLRGLPPALWFTRKLNPGLTDILDATPDVLEWMDRLAAIGHGRSDRMSSTDAVGNGARGHARGDQGRGCVPGRPRHPPGQPRTIAAEAFGTETSEGVLRAATRTRYTIERHDDRAGTVHVHFPRVGYSAARGEGLIAWRCPHFDDLSAREVL